MLSSRLGIGRREAMTLARALRRARPDSERTRAAGAGVNVVAWGQAGYPTELMDLLDPPCAVYLRGELLQCDARAVVVTGARRATRYGLRVARADIDARPDMPQGTLPSGSRHLSGDLDGDGRQELVVWRGRHYAD